MSLKLPQLSQQWALPELIKNLIESFRLIEAADKSARKTNADVDLGPNRLILTDTVDGTKYIVSVASGVVTLTAI